MVEKNQMVEVICPKCRDTRIISLPAETLPKCAQCNLQMIIKEILTEGKCY